MLVCIACNSVLVESFSKDGYMVSCPSCGWDLVDYGGAKHFRNTYERSMKNILALSKKLEAAKRRMEYQKDKERIKALREKARKKRFAALLTDPDNERHGTVSAYNDGCRCERCLEAGRAYKRKSYRPVSK